jgi:glycosyltransferase involved in cell wall biosynthesis
MKLIHTSSWYFPDTSGGVDVYIDSLAQSLQVYGFESVVAAPRTSTEENTYKYNHIHVYRYPVYPHPEKIQVQKQMRHGGFEFFANWLKTHPVDIYHQHSWRFDCGLHHLAMAKKLGIPTVITVHMPEILCLQGTMMKYNLEPCTGLIDSGQCSRCLGVPERVPLWAIAALSQVPLGIGLTAEAKLLSFENIKVRVLGKTFGIPPLVPEQRRQLRQLAKLADLIVVPSHWQYKSFLLNGVPEAKLRLCRQGVAENFSATMTTNKPNNPTLKIGFLGRWQETKGVQVLAAAVSRLPRDIPVELVIHATHADQYGAANRDKVMAMAAGDRRIKIAETLSRSQVPQAVANFDLLAVPSQWMETGPIVVMEAQAVGTPVLGSNLGGIAELVTHKVDGWLVPASDIPAWTEAIANLAQDRNLLGKLRKGIQPARTMDTVALEMIQMYQEISGNFSKTLET